MSRKYFEYSRDNKVEYVQQLLEDYTNEIVNDVIENVDFVFPMTRDKDMRDNKNVIMSYLQDKFCLSRKGYPKGQKNYWIIRGFLLSEAEERIKEYSSCYSRSPDSIEKKYGCSHEEAIAIFQDRNSRATETRNAFSEEEKARINKLKQQKLQDFIDRYGEQEGIFRYNRRIERYKKSMSFDTLIERYGEQEAKRIVQDRRKRMSTSYQSLVERYGEQEAKLRYEQQIERKSKAHTLSGYIDRYGIEEGTQKYKARQEKYIKTWKEKSSEELALINRKKSTSLEAFRNKYGDEEGFVRYQKCIEKRRYRASKTSLQVFVPLYEWLLQQGVEDREIWFGYKNKSEYFLSDGSTFYSYDFCVPRLKLIYEFNGTCFHPKSADDDKWSMPYNTNITAAEKFAFDQTKNQFAIDRGFEVIVLWEDVAATENLMYAIQTAQKKMKE